MAAETLSYLWDNYMHRFLAEGINYRDLLDLRERITTIEEWPARWSEMGAQYEQRADAALAAKDRVPGPIMRVAMNVLRPPRK